MTDILLCNILIAGFDEMLEALRRMHSIERTQDVRGVSRMMGGKKSAELAYSRYRRASDRGPPGTDLYPIHRRAKPARSLPHLSTR
jgi:hypothetical protein